LSDGIHIPEGTGVEKPGRNLRNLGEHWEPLQVRTGTGTGISDGAGDVYGLARREGWEAAA